MAENVTPYEHRKLFETCKPDAKFRLVSKEGIRSVSAGDREILEVSPAALTALAREAFLDVSFLLRRRHNEQLAGPANAARPFGRVDETMARLLHVARFADALAPTHR